MCESPKLSELKLQLNLFSFFLTKKKGQDLNNLETYTRVFDSKSASTVINLTELLIFKYRPHIARSLQKPKTLDDYLEHIVQMLPISLMWSHPFDVAGGSTGELLFVTLKSSEIIVFLVSWDQSERIQVELVHEIRAARIEAEPAESDEANVQGLLSMTENGLTKSRQITSTCFWHDKGDNRGVLAFGFFNGDIYLTSLSIAQFNTGRDR